jgi:hypothetical protein
MQIAAAESSHSSPRKPDGTKKVGPLPVIVNVITSGRRSRGAGSIRRSSVPWMFPFHYTAICSIGIICSRQDVNSLISCSDQDDNPIAMRLARIGPHQNGSVLVLTKMGSHRFWGCGAFSRASCGGQLSRPETDLNREMPQGTRKHGLTRGRSRSRCPKGLTRKCHVESQAHLRRAQPEPATLRLFHAGEH